MFRENTPYTVEETSDGLLCVQTDNCKFIHFVLQKKLKAIGTFTICLSSFILETADAPDKCSPIVDVERNYYEIPDQVKTSDEFKEYVDKCAGTSFQRESTSSSSELPTSFYKVRNF